MIPWFASLWSMFNIQDHSPPPLTDRALNLIWFSLPEFRRTVITKIIVLISKIAISSFVFGLKKSCFPLIHLPSCYRTVCYWAVCYRTAQ